MNSSTKSISSSGSTTPSSKGNGSNVTSISNNMNSSSNIVLNTVANSALTKITIGPDRLKQIIESLEIDHLSNVTEFIKTRKLYRKLSKVCKIIGSSLMYIGSALSSSAAAITLVSKSSEATNCLLFTSSICFSAHIVFISVAKLSIREEIEHERQLQDLATVAGFHVTTLIPSMNDDMENGNLPQQQQQQQLQQQNQQLSANDNNASELLSMRLTTPVVRSGLNSSDQLLTVSPLHKVSSENN